MSKGPILIVEDDRKTSSLLALYLERDGFTPLAAFDGVQALDLAKRGNPKMIILDLMLPRMDGWTLCQELRRFSSVPVLVLSARGEPHEKILGLSLGADDYVAKPFSPAEVVARVNAILRRSAFPEHAGRHSHDGLVLDLEKRRVTCDEREVGLTRSEYKLLATLMASPGRTFNREELLNRIYSNGSVVVDRSIDVHIGKLRQKIERNPASPRYVLTVRGVGYKFADRDARDAQT